MKKKILFTLLLTTLTGVNAKQTLQQLRQQAQLNAKADAEFVQSFKNQNKGTVTFATVGADSCDFTTIQAAVDSAVDEVRIATNTSYNENVFLTDISVKLRGGYSTCVAAQSDNQGNAKSHIIGVPNAGEPVIAITGNSQRNSVTLENLELTGGSGLSFLSGGGISTLSADAYVALVNLAIHDNHSSFGGGIAIQGNSNNTDTDFMLSQTVIYDNSAFNGGGVFCNGANSSIVLIDNSGIHANQALEDVNNSGNTGRGGGAYLELECKLSMYSGTKTSNQTTDKRGIAYNSAQQYGGGMYVENATANLNGHQYCYNLGTQICLGNNQNPLNINNNTAAKIGGGIYSLGSNAILSIYAGLVENNTVTAQASWGGGVAIQSTTFVTAQLSKKCWNNKKCNLYRNNSSRYQGGAMWLNGIADVYTTFFENNRANSGTAIMLQPAPANGATETSIQSSVFFHNGNNGADGFNDRDVITISGFSSTSRLTHNTFVDNNALSVFFYSPDEYTEQTQIQYSIIHESNPNINILDPTSNNYDSRLKFECLLVSEDSFTNYPQINVLGDVVVADPMFVDRANNDYHIKASVSPAVDFCQSQNITHYDMDMENFGWNDPSVPNQNGVAFNTYDVGADETYGNDIIFKHGFEQN